jgi:hypothetical protein
MICLGFFACEHKTIQLEEEDSVSKKDLQKPIIHQRIMDSLLSYSNGIDFFRTKRDAVFYTISIQENMTSILVSIMMSETIPEFVKEDDMSQCEVIEGMLFTDSFRLVIHDFRKEIFPVLYDSNSLNRDTIMTLRQSLNTNSSFVVHSHVERPLKFNW